MLYGTKWWPVKSKPVVIVHRNSSVRNCPKSNKRTMCGGQLTYKQKSCLENCSAKLSCFHSSRRPWNMAYRFNRRGLFINLLTSADISTPDQTDAVTVSAECLFWQDLAILHTKQATADREDSIIEKTQFQGFMFPQVVERY